MERIFQQARDRGGTYLAERFRASRGEILASAGEYYKLPAAFLVTGRTAEAACVLDWVRAEGMLVDGDIGPRPGATRGYYHTYYNVWIIQGAQRMGMFDIAQRGASFVARSWDADSGGFYSSITETGPEVLEDLWVTCGAGQSMLYANRLEIARGAGRWLERLMHLQPDYPARLYAVYSREEGVHTQYPPEEEVRFVLDPSRDRDEYFFNPGIAGGFLASLSRATGESRWRDLAEEYMRQCEVACETQFRSLRAGKVGWAASQLYRLTGREKYRQYAERVGRNLIASQAADGAWKPEFMSWIDATAEMVVWLDEISQALET
ncbi:MAG: hypothetical protein ACKV22_34395 [Bryobacteraceae bacterium]